METGRKRAPLEFIPPEGFPGDREPIAQRFWKYVDRSGGPDACWLWMGSLRRNNYGHALREAFMAGAKWQRDHPESKPVT